VCGAAGLAAGLAIAACGRKSEAPRPNAAGGRLEAGALAQVNDVQLTEEDLQRLVPPDFREGITGPEIRDVLERWIRTELLYQKARQDNLQEDPQVAARLREMERELLADELLQRELTSRARVTAEEVQAYYDAHQQEYTQELHLAQIVLETREVAETVLQQLRSGASFEVLAQQHSIDPTASRGGDLGFLGKGALNAAFEPYVFDMQEGEIIGPIPSSFGFHIVKLIARRGALEPVFFDAARDEILHALLLQKQQKAQAELLKELRADSQVRVAATWAGMSLALVDSAAAVRGETPYPVQSVGEPAGGVATEPDSDGGGHAP
jgi:peptidyl-prolyl cis-trans isomerase C